MALEDLVALEQMASTALARHNPPALQRQLISAASHLEVNVKIKPFACNRLQTIPVGSI